MAALDENGEKHEKLSICLKELKRKKGFHEVFFRTHSPLKGICICFLLEIFCRSKGETIAAKSDTNFLCVVEKVKIFNSLNRGICFNLFHFLSID